MSEPTVRQVAEILISGLKASGKPRGRISFKSIEGILGRRANIKFLAQLMDECEQLYHPLVELHRGGFAMISALALDGAPILKFDSEPDGEYP